MCTRFYIDADNRFVRELKEKAEMTKLAERFRNKTQKSISFGEKRPADIVPVLAPDKENRPAPQEQRHFNRIDKTTDFTN